jgi:hypothetical protein
MSDGTQNSQSEPHSKPSSVGMTTNKEIHSLDYPPIAEEDLVELGVESRLIPFIVSTTLRVEQSPNDPPLLSPAEAEDLVETLDKVRLHP